MLATVQRIGLEEAMREAKECYKAFQQSKQEMLMVCAGHGSSGDGEAWTIQTY